ncbi:MAG: hypothetical protein A2Z88_05740, partial [Omnitrophica WOR_2 bacterium GWA2_47_8]
MYFKRLELFGFKSFADRTVLNFEPGITAIVGPNGCGKSNIFDAIRWVLGEQSVKELRGSSMEDVIFNGTDKKAALGFAEVSLSFSNESKSLPIEHDEVTITRRLYRSGESEYLLNKGAVRLKDIQELFMGTGIGAEAYSLIQQGKVDLVVSAKPEDRRILIDEAAGITKYKSKKREALNKLKDTEANLLRLNDIILEVKRQIASLERQASKARRYKDEFEKLQKFEVHLAKFDLQNFSSEKERLTQELQNFNSRESELTNELTELNNFLENQGSFLEEIEQKINEANSEDIKLEGQVDIHNKQIGFNEERIENLSVNTNRMREKKAELIDRCQSQQNKIEDLKKVLIQLAEDLKQKAELLKDKKDLLHLTENAVSVAHNEIKDNEERILETTSKQVGIKNQLTEIMKEIQGALARKRRLELENTKVNNEKTEIDERLTNVSSQIHLVIEKIDGLKISQQSAAEIFSKIKSQISAVHNEINELEKKRVSLRSQKEFIEKLQVQYQDIPDPIVEGRLITSVPPTEKHSGIIGKVKEVFKLDQQQCEKLFEQGVIGRNDYEALYQVICEAKFIESDPALITMKIEEVDKEIEGKIIEKDQLIVQIEQQEKEISRLNQEAQEQEKSLSILESQKNDIVGESSKLSSELEVLNLEIVEVQETFDVQRKKEDELNFYFDSLNQELEALKNSIKDKQKLVSQKLQEKEEVTVFIAQMETEIQGDGEKQTTYQENLSLFEQTLDHELGEIKKIDDEIQENDAKRQQYEEGIASSVSAIEQLKEKRQAFKRVLSDYEKQKEDIAQQLNSRRASLRGVEEELEQLRSNLHGFQMKEQEIGFKEKAIEDRLLQAYRINIHEITDAALPEEYQQLAIGSPEFAEELGRLKKRCESFGSVNLVAIEEFEELRQRFEFLTKQQSDLLEAKESLHQTITKINRQTRQMFMETFTKVSEEFRIYFRMLFGGGEANLILIDPENVLESGIEIVARPPGKKLQNISLLSGGEKSLTAIALVFGIFKVNPSPFCVLDEIDAALDEANVGRYSYLLKDFAKIAQFIVITHNKTIKR